MMDNKIIVKACLKRDNNNCLGSSNDGQQHVSIGKYD